MCGTNSWGKRSNNRETQACSSMLLFSCCLQSSFAVVDKNDISVHFTLCWKRKEDKETQNIKCRETLRQAPLWTSRVGFPSTLCKGIIVYKPSKQNWNLYHKGMLSWRGRVFSLQRPWRLVPRLWELCSRYQLPYIFNYSHNTTRMELF